MFDAMNGRDVVRHVPGGRDAVGRDHRGHDEGGLRPARPIRVCFFFNAQRHQILHGVSTAVALSRRPGFEVHVMSPSMAHVAYAEQTAAKLGGAPIVFSGAGSALLTALQRATGGSVPPKVLSLGVLARRLNGFDAIAVPERTSIALKRMGVGAPRYIHLDHGAGDRAAGFDKRIGAFDFVLMAGEKHRMRLAREGLIHPGRHAVAGYPKFEAADAVRDPHWSPFADRRPVVLYNPHFSTLGSWERFGEPVLRAFAGQDRYNLVVAPHVRMLDARGPQARWSALAATYAACGRIHIDTGSDRCIDMTYTTLADIYLGDVSSQVYEFLRTPRPCVFLDGRNIDWAVDENYAHWRFGPVVQSPSGVLDAVDSAVSGHWRFLDAQIDGFAATFSQGEAPASRRAAEAIAGYLEAEAATSAPKPVRGTQRHLPQAAALAVVAAVGGWSANEAVDHRRGDPEFVEEAVASHRTTLIRASMKSQPEAHVLDPVEIRAATGLRVPPLSTRWALTDVQIYPSDWGPIVQVAAVTERGEPVSLVAMRIDVTADRAPILRTHKGERVAYWEDGGQAYGVVGAIPANRLLGLAAELARAAGPN